MQIAPGVHRVTVGQSNIPTLSPPNVYLVVGERAAFIDTGYNREEHIKARLDYLQDVGSPKVTAIAITHRHPDHAGGAAAIHRATGAPILTHSAEKEFIEKQLDQARVDRALAGGETLDLGGVTLEFIHTPGHTLGSMCVLLREQGLLFTGDTVMGFGTSVIDPDEGDMALFIESLRKLLKYDLKTICPGHGMPVKDPRAKLQELIDHRLQREREMLSLLRRGPCTIDDFLKELYIKPGINSHLHDMARSQIKAHLIKLEREQKVRATDGRNIFALG